MASDSGLGTRSLVTVAAAGTPIRLSSHAADATLPILCTQISVQALKALGASGAADTPNSGVIYLLNSSTAKGASSTNIVVRLESDTGVFTLRSLKPCGLNLADYYIDAQTSGDGALVSWC